MTSMNLEDESSPVMESSEIDPPPTDPSQMGYEKGTPWKQKSGLRNNYHNFLN